jgi:phosphohistidine phosphatase
MKTLLLMRHARSSWDDSNQADQERPLNKRGRRDAPMMGQLLIDRELIPQLILSSSAVRARQTAEIVAEAAQYQGEIVYLDRLYMAEADEYINTLRELPDQIERVMVIGHNPSLESVLQVLADRVESLPTAVLAYIVLSVEHWSELSTKTSGEVVEIWRPKELREEVEEAQEKEKEKGKAKEKPQAKGKEKAKSKKKGK